MPLLLPGMHPQQLHSFDNALQFNRIFILDLFKSLRQSKTIQY